MAHNIYTKKPLKNPKGALPKDSRTGVDKDMSGNEQFDFIPYPVLIYSLEGKIVYINDTYTEIFGWTPDDLKNNRMPSIPFDLQKKIMDSSKEFPKVKVFRIETKLPAKGRGFLDVDITGKFIGYKHGPRSVAVIIRDITKQKKSTLTNEILLRISTELPSYPALGDLMDYISKEISCLLNTNSAVVLLLDEESNEIFFQGVGMDDFNRRKLIKKIRIPADKSITGKVIRTGNPLIIHDTATDPDYYQGVDEQMNIRIKNMLIVPLRNSDRVIGVLNAVNKKEGKFDATDLELLTLIAGTIALSIENARVSSRLKDAYNEVTSLNRAKDRLISHLSHELNTPVSVLTASMNIIGRKIDSFPEANLSPTLERAKRNLERILELQYELQDIMHGKEYRSYGLLSFLLEECADELESLAAEEIGEGQVVQRIRDRIDEIFGPNRCEITENRVNVQLTATLNKLRPQFSHRNLEVIEHIEKSSPISISSDALEKVLSGLIKNAIENTPDEGKIEVSVADSRDGVEFILHDYGVGITEEDKKRIFEGFYPTQQTMHYSSKRPFDFNAGGKGADLLRIKIFSERYNFHIHTESSRCRFLSNKNVTCPGRISRCAFCNNINDCYNSGGTTFRLFFPFKS